MVANTRKNLATSPILLITFNRPTSTRQVLEKIRDRKPEQIFIAGDGPRNREDSEQISQVRAVVDELVDWPCDLNLNFNSTNLGCRRGVTRAIDWFFGHVEEGIILEDDTVPNLDFFYFCEELLERYRGDPSVMHISGDNSAGVSIREDWSYCFIRYPHIWGWATWKTAWNLYDRELRQFQAFRDSGRLGEVFADSREGGTWIPRFEELLELGTPDTWDWQWSATVYLNSGLSIQPTVNLISNIGFGPDATHTLKPGSRSYVPTGSILPLVHPPRNTGRHMSAERQVFRRTHAVTWKKKTRRIAKLSKKVVRKVLRRFIRGVRQTAGFLT